MAAQKAVFASEGKDKTNTKVIHKSHFLFKSDDPFVTGEKVKIYADIVEFDKNLKNPVKITGDLTIYARKIIVPKSGASIHASGGKGGDAPKSRADDGKSIGEKGKRYLTETNAMRRSLDGKDGKEGNHGATSNNVSIYTHEITGGNLTINANGGDGGNGQPGGYGAKPEYYSDKELTKEEKNKTLTYNEKRYTKKEKVKGYYILVNNPGFLSWDFLAAMPGPRTTSFDGGKAGTGGKGGDGGNGGKVTVYTPDVAVMKKRVTATIEKGKRGKTGVSGFPGSPGPDSGFGRSWFITASNSQVGSNDDQRGDWRSGNLDYNEDMLGNAIYNEARGGKLYGWEAELVKDKFIRYDEREKRLKLTERVTHGGALGKLGKQVASKNGKDGTKGEFIVADVKNADVDIDDRYLLLLMHNADVAEFNGKTDEAKQIQDWLSILTSLAKKKSPVCKSVNKRAKSGVVRKLNQSGVTPNWCIQYVNLNNCMTAVERYLDLMITFENRYEAFMAEEDNRKNVLFKINQSIKSYKEISEKQKQEIERVTARETQLKDGIIGLTIKLKSATREVREMPRRLREDIEVRQKEKEFWATIDFITDIVDISGYAFNLGAAFLQSRKMTKRAEESFKTNFKKWQDADGRATVNLINAGNSKDKAGKIKNAFLDTSIFKSDFRKAYDSDEENGNSAFNSLLEAGFAPNVFYKIYNLSTAEGRKQAEQVGIHDEVDLEAIVTFPEQKLLELKLAKSNFKAFIKPFLEKQFSSAAEFDRRYMKMYLLGEAKVDLIQKLSNQVAARENLEFQKHLTDEKIKNLKSQKETIEKERKSNPAAELVQKLNLNVEAYYVSALKLAMELFRQEVAAYHAFTLTDYVPPNMEVDFSAKDILDVYHKPYAASIADAIAFADNPENLTYQQIKEPPFVYLLSKSDLKELKAGNEIQVPIPVSQNSRAGAVKLIEITIRLAGAVSGSDFYYELRHSGLCNFLTKEKKKGKHKELSYSLPEKEIDGNYAAVVATGEDSKVEVSYKEASNPLTSTFPSKSNEVAYSPFANWYLSFPKEYSIHDGGYVYNTDINWKKCTHIEIRFKISYEKLKTKKQLS